MIEAQRARSRKPNYPVPGVYHVFIKERNTLPLEFYFNKHIKMPIHQMDECNLNYALKILNEGSRFNYKPIEMYIEAISIQQQFLDNCNTTRSNQCYNYNGERHWYYSKPKIVTHKVSLCEKIAKFIFPEFLFTKMYSKSDAKKELANRFNKLLEKFQSI